MSNASTFLGGGAAIKSVQRGTISSTASPATATVTAVDTTRSVIKLMDTTPGLWTSAYVSTRVELTDATTVSMHNAVGAPITSAASATWELVEYAAPIKSIQQVAVTLSGANQRTHLDTAITSVDLSKTILEFRGYQGGAESLSADVEGFMLKGTLTSSTNLRVYNRANKQTPYGLIGHFTIVEFF